MSKREELGQIVIRPPAGLRDRIRRASEASGRSMNAEVVAALLAHFPEPSAEDLLTALHRDMVALQLALMNPAMSEDRLEAVRGHCDRLRSEMMSIINGDADPEGFADRIRQVSGRGAAERYGI